MRCGVWPALGRAEPLSKGFIAAYPGSWHCIVQGLNYGSRSRVAHPTPSSTKVWSIVTSNSGLPNLNPEYFRGPDPWKHRYDIINRENPSTTRPSSRATLLTSSIWAAVVPLPQHFRATSQYCGSLELPQLCCSSPFRNIPVRPIVKGSTSVMLVGPLS